MLWSFSLGSWTQQCTAAQAGEAGSASSCGNMELGPTWCWPRQRDRCWSVPGGELGREFKPRGSTSCKQQAVSPSAWLRERKLGSVTESLREAGGEQAADSTERRSHDLMCQYTSPRGHQETEGAEVTAQAAREADTDWSVGGRGFHAWKTTKGRRTMAETRK